MNRKAFTLIELLVVIAIIGILAGLITPVFGRARESARRALCANNLRQHGIAWYLYLDEHDDCFPTMWSSSAELASTMTFGGKTGSAYDPLLPMAEAQYRPLNKYVDVYDDSSPGVELFHCPDDMGYRGRLPYPPFTEVEYDSTFNTLGSSYQMNSRIVNFDDIYNPRRRPLSTITSPRNKVYLENCYYFNRPGHRIKYSEGGYGMVLFVDGHVAGPFYDEQLGGDGDYEKFEPATTKPVIKDPNGTPSDWD